MVTIADHLQTSQEEIWKSWRNRVNEDPDLTTGAGLSRTLFNDHIPDILDSFARRLQAWPDEISTRIQGLE